MIQVDIEKRLNVYQGRQTLKIKHGFDPGSITKIYGPSGSGKTTFLKIIAGLINPDQGRINVGDDIWLDTHQGIDLSPQKRMPGFVFQDYALFPNMSVLQHLQYVTADAAWINRLLKLAKLDSFVHHKPQHLSGGQQQRLAIIRALAIKPSLVLMDEPFSALDYEMKEGLISELKQVFDELKATVLIVSHHPTELAGLINAELLIVTESD